MPTLTSKLQLSDIAPSIVQSEIRAMSVECDRVGGINLAQGICDTELPSVVATGAVDAIHAGFNIYTRLDGVSVLREAIAAKLLSYNHSSVDPESEVLVTSGATGALYASLLALLNPGDEVIVFEPFYGYHVSTLLSLRMRPVIVPLAKPDWRLDLDALRDSVTPNTRAIIVNTPSNPSGKVFGRSELEAIALLALEHDLFVFTDEIYEYFLFDGVKHISLATLPGMKDRTITISGLSKTFSITGWRIGYLTASSRWISTIGYFHDLTYICSPAPLQFGAAAGLRQLTDNNFYTRLACDYESKRDQLCDALEDAGLRPFVPRVLITFSPTRSALTAQPRANGPALCCGRREWLRFLGLPSFDPDMESTCCDSASAKSRPISTRPVRGCGISRCEVSRRCCPFGRELGS